LGGSTYTSIIATVTPKEEHSQETLSTLHFAQRAKSVKNVITRNVTIEDTVSGLRKEIRTLKRMMSESALKNKKIDTPTSSIDAPKKNEEDEDEDENENDEKFQEFATMKISLNQKIKESADLKRAQMEMEEEMLRIRTERELLQKKANESEDELEKLRLRHARVVSERRRSSIGLSGNQSNSRRESTLYSIMENMENMSIGCNDKSSTTSNAHTQTTTCDMISIDDAEREKEIAVDSAIDAALDSYKASEKERIDVAVAKAKSEYEVKEKKFKETIQSLRNDLLKSKKTFEEISSEASKEQKELNNTIDELSDKLKDSQDEANVLRDRLQIIEKRKPNVTILKKNKKATSSSSSKTTNKVEVSTIQIPFNISKTPETSPQMPLFGISFQSNDLNNARSILASSQKIQSVSNFFTMNQSASENQLNQDNVPSIQKKNVKMKNRDSSSSVSSNDSVRSKGSLHVTKGGRGRNSLRNLFSSAAIVTK
jgi:myosin heavy subunit